MLGLPYWANIAPLQWPYIGPMSNEQTALGLCWMPMLAHHCRQYWANIGPTLALYTTTLSHAWLPILGQHCANAVALYWANEQTALLCWVPMLAHHCRQHWTNIGSIYNYIEPCLASHIGPTLRQCSGPILGQWANCIGPMLDANVGPSLPPILGQYWTNIGPIYKYIEPCLASNIGPTLRQCSGPILGQWANCIAMLGANVGPSLPPILDQCWLAGWVSIYIYYMQPSFQTKGYCTKQIIFEVQ